MRGSFLLKLHSPHRRPARYPIGVESEVNARAVPAPFVVRGAPGCPARTSASVGLLRLGVSSRLAQVGPGRSRAGGGRTSGTAACGEGRASAFGDAVLSPAGHVAVEHFDKGALVLDVFDQAVVELDARQGFLLRCLDGRRPVAEAAEALARAFRITDEEARKLSRQTCDTLLRKDFLRLVAGDWPGGAMETVRYVQNPDVNLREEDEDGALLFNPDTDAVQLLNASGRFIWGLCARGRTLKQVVAAVKAEFTEVPESQVTGDVEEFIEQMMGAGFIGVQKEA